MHFDLYTFRRLLSSRDIDGAKGMVTTRDIYQPIICALCIDGPDDVDLLHYFIDIGVQIILTECFSPISLAAKNRKNKLLQELLRLGVGVGFAFGERIDSIFDSPLYEAISVENVFGIHLLLDNCAKTEFSLYWERSRMWPHFGRKIFAGRARLRASAIVMLGLLRCHSPVITGNGVDVLRVIAKSMWSQRYVVSLESSTNRPPSKKAKGKK